MPYETLQKTLAKKPDDELARIAASDAQVLYPWARDFARWLASSKKAPRIEDQLAKLFELTGETWTVPRLKTLTANTRFREYRLIMQERGLRAARERIAEVAVDAVEGLAEGIAFTRAEKDYNTMAKLTSQALERALPHDKNLLQQNVQVNVAFSDKVKALLESERPVIEVEVVPPEKND